MVSSKHETFLSADEPLMVCTGDGTAAGITLIRVMGNPPFSRWASTRIRIPVISVQTNVVAVAPLKSLSRQLRWGYSQRTRGLYFILPSSIDWRILQMRHTLKGCMGSAVAHLAMIHRIESPLYKSTKYILV